VKNTLEMNREGAGKKLSTSSKKAIQKARANRIIHPPKRVVILSFAELGDQK